MGPHGFTFYFVTDISVLYGLFVLFKIWGSVFIWTFFPIFTYFLKFQISAHSTPEKHSGFNVSFASSLLSCYFMLSAIQFCQFLFMSSLCKLSFHPEMEFSFMLKLLLSFCHLVSYRLLL